MKILYFIPSINNPGGMERVLFQKINNLLTYGFEISIVTSELEKHNESFFRLDPSVKVYRSNVDFNSYVGKNLLMKVAAYYLKKKRFKNYIENVLFEFDPDICVSLFGKEFSFLSSIKHRSVKIGEIHFSKDFRRQVLVSRNSGIIHKIIGKLRTIQLEYTASRFDHIVVLTKEDLANWNIKNISCIPNPCIYENDINYFDFNHNKAIAVGRLDPQKGFEILIDAWAIVERSHPQWSLDIYGDGYLNEILQNKIDRYNLGNVVKINNPRLDIDEIYKSSSLFILSSIFEGFGLVLVEAMSFGIPSIAFACKCGPRDIINNNISGILIDKLDAESLANGIVELISDPQKMSEISKEALIESKKFHVENIIPLWINLFNQLMHDKNSSN